MDSPPLVFRSLEDFRPWMQQQHPTWRQRVEQGLRRIALAGIADPITDQPIAPQDLQVEHNNYRETISHQGVISRQRAVLLVLRQLIASGALPPWQELRCYASEAVTPFSERLSALIPKQRCSEYLPEPDHWLRGSVPNRDLRRFGLPPATFHAVLCNVEGAVTQFVEGEIFQGLRIGHSSRP